MLADRREYFVHAESGIGAERGGVRHTLTRRCADDHKC
jgi:hypothetical protein